VAALDSPGVHHQHGRAVDRRVGGHGVDECDIVDMLGDVGEQIADPFATLSVLLEIPARLDDPPLVFVSTAPEGFHGDDLVVTPLHRRLVIERIDVAWSTVHEQKDDAFCFGCKVGFGEFTPLRCVGIPEELILGEHSCEG